MLDNTNGLRYLHVLDDRQRVQHKVHNPVQHDNVNRDIRNCGDKAFHAIYLCAIMQTKKYARVDSKDTRQFSQ